MEPEPTHLVYVVDDDAAARESLRFLLESVGLTVLDFGTPRAFLEFRRPTVPSCLVLDVRMPEMTGIELLEVLRQGGSTMPVVMFTAFGDVPTTVRAFKAGAVDLVEKPSSGTQIIEAVQSGLRADEARRSAAHARQELLDRVGTLSSRERQVLVLLVRGSPNKVIAAELGISVKTVEIHRARVMEKMQASSLAELVRLALLVGEKAILPPPP